VQFSCVDPEERLSSPGHAGELLRADYLLEFQAQLCPLASLFFSGRAIHPTIRQEVTL